MKFLNIFIFAITVLIITGCSSDSTGTGTGISIDNVIGVFGCESGNVPLTGCWVTERCATAEDGDDNFLGYWVRGVYDFAEDGNIHYAQLKYNNDSCTGLPFEDSIFPVFFPETYVETGTEMTSDGLEGHRITYTHDTTDFEAIYVVTVENKLCFSDNIVFGANSNRYTALGPNPAINYNDCLLDINQF